VLEFGERAGETEQEQGEEQEQREDQAADGEERGDGEAERRYGQGLQVEPPWARYMGERGSDLEAGGGA
jgi:hypothetical protein